MKKVIVLSVNENPIYQFILPLVVWSWLRIDWTPFIFFVGERDERRRFVEKTISDFGQMAYGSDVLFKSLEGYRTDTIAQVSRLYAAQCLGNHKDYILTGDSDMMALSDYWKFDSKKITVWGHDLTGYQQMPICYIGMTCERWREVMAFSGNFVETSMKFDLDEMPDARENGNQIERWCTDQRLITKKINEVQFEKEFIHRGTLSNGYPVGRIDRSAWATYHPQPIDCHLPHNIYSSDEAFAKVMRMLASIFPSEDFHWFANYTEEFKKLI